MSMGMELAAGTNFRRFASIQVGSCGFSPYIHCAQGVMADLKRKPATERFVEQTQFAENTPHTLTTSTLKPYTDYQALVR